jgi:hypothetical protein
MMNLSRTQNHQLQGGGYSSKVQLDTNPQLRGGGYSSKVQLDTNPQLLGDGCRLVVVNFFSRLQIMNFKVVGVVVHVRLQTLAIAHKKRL